MEKTQPLVTIGIPVYNGARHIEQALDSVLAQDYANLEIIISDNASTDKTAEICQTYLQKDKRIQYHRNTENKGAAKNYSFVLDQANGTYFTWLACDDLFDSPAYISSLINFMENHEDVALCSCSMRTFYEEDTQAVSYRVYDPIFNEKEWEKARLEFFRYPPRLELVIYGVYRTEILKKIPTVHENFKHPDIFAMFLLMPQICSYGRIVALPEALRAYRCNLDSLAYTISSRDLFWYALRIKVTLLQLAYQFDASWSYKIKLMFTALKNFNPFKRSVSMRHELKLLRKEVAVLRVACAKRLEIINQLSAQLKQ